MEHARPAAEQSVQPVNARLNRLHLVTRSHKTWVALLGFFFTFDLLDLNVFAYVAPALRNEWGLSIGAIGAITSASFVGMFVGGMLGGRLADRFGRRKVILAAGACYSVCSLASAFSPNAEILAVTRVFTGLGLQAMTGVLLVYVSEMFPRDKRGRYQSLILALGLVGVPLAAAFSRLIIPLGPESWRWVFVIGASGLIGVAAAVRLLPESIRWQVSQGREAEAETLLARLEAEALAATDKPSDWTESVSVVEVAEPVVGARILDLFNAAYRKRTVVCSLVMICLILSLYGFNSWVPTLLVERGYTSTQSLTYSLILSFAAVPGALLAWPIVDRFERKNLLFGIATVIAILMLAFGFITHLPVVVVTGFLVTMLLQTLVAVLYTYLPEVFPTGLRGLGSGLANSLGRLAGVAGGLIVAAIFSGLGFSAVFVYVAAVMFLLGVLMMAFGEKTTNRRLEELAGSVSSRTGGCP
jgi:MFS transporter, putative metabolite:H+ symporter